MRNQERGNIFFTLFGAVAVVGVLGAATVSMMRGPLSTMVEVNRRTMADTQMQIASKLALLTATMGAENGDCEAVTASAIPGDGFVEPVEWDDDGGGSVGPGAVTGSEGGGWLPASIGASQTDPWGTRYGYCVWDAGTIVDDGNCGGGSQKRLVGKGPTATVPPSDEDEAHRTYPVMAIIAAGPDRQFQTGCVDFATADADGNGKINGSEALVVKASGSDDIILQYTYAEASATSGGLWRLSTTDPSTATIDKNINVEQGGSFGGAITVAPGVTDYNEFPYLKADYISAVTAAAVPDFVNGLDLSNVGTELAACTVPGQLGVDNAGAPTALLMCLSGQWIAIGGVGGAGGKWQDGTDVGTDIYYNGMVGINTTNPGVALDVVGDVRLTEALMMGTGKQIQWGNTTITGTGAGAMTLSTNAGTGLFDLSGAGDAGIGVMSTAGTRLLVKSAGNTNATTALNVTNSDDASAIFVRDDLSVGINDTNPDDPLEVGGTIDLSGYLKVDNQWILAADDTNAPGSLYLGLGAPEIGGAGVTGGKNTVIGTGSGLLVVAGADNTVLGAESAIALAGGADNVVIGQGAAPSLAAGQGNIIIGAREDTGPVEIDIPGGADNDYMLNIGNLILGDMGDGDGQADTTVAIGYDPTTIDFAALTAALEVNGGVDITGTVNIPDGNLRLSGTEFGIPVNCTGANEALQWNGDWVCATASTGSDSDDDLSNNNISDLQNVSSDGNDGDIFINTSGTWTPYAMTGDVAISNVGVTTIQNNAVETVMIADANVTTAKIADGNVTLSKIEDITAGVLLGRTDASAGAPQEITVGSGLSLSGTTISASLTAGDIPADALDFDKFVDGMTLDNTTTITAPNGQAYTLSIINDGTGNSFSVLDEVGDLTPFVIDAGGNISTGGNVSMLGDLTITGDDLFMATNNAGYILVADNTNFNPVPMSGDIAIDATGATTIQPNAVETGMIAGRNVTYPKLPEQTESTLLGRGQGAGNGDTQEITLGSGLTMTGTTISASIGSGNIADDSLDFDKFVDGMTLDATTTITAPNAQAYELSVINDGTGNSFSVLDEVGDLTPFVIDAGGNISTGGNVSMLGDLTVTGDDLFMATNTAGYILVADDTNFNPVAMSGDIAIDATGATTIQPLSVETGMIADDAVTYAKIQNTSAGEVLLGKPDAGAGAVTEITLGTGLAFSGGQLVADLDADDIPDDSLDFDKFVDAMNLDVSTSIIADNAETLSIVNTGTGNSFLVMDEAGDTSPFVIDTDGNIVIGAATARGRLDVNGGDFIVSGVHSGTASVPASGAGTRMFFDSENSAFRVGAVDGVQWDNANVGDYSAALNANTIASGTASFATGWGTIASGSDSFSAGYQTTASGYTAIAGGTTSVASGDSSFAFGNNVVASGQNAFALGHEVIAGNGVAASGFGDYSMAIGLGDASTATFPRITGDGSLGIFMGDQESVDMAANNTFGLFGGQMLIDPGAPATTLAANSSAALEIASTTKGFLPPRMTIAQRNAIGAPATGLTVFATDAGTSGLLQFWDGDSWENIGAGGAVSSALSDLTAATGTNTIVNSDHAQVWNWALTTADNDAFTFGESAAASGGGSQSVLKAQTLVSSTATPLMVTNLGDGLSLRVNDETGDADATPFVVDAEGNVGIGVAAPTGRLQIADEVVSGNADVLILRNRDNHNGSASGLLFTAAMSGGNSLTNNLAAIRGVTVSDALDAGALTFSTLAGGLLTEKMRISEAGTVGIGTYSPTYLLSLDGNSADQTIGMERETTAATAGRALTLLAGGADAGSSDLAGGTLNLSSGTATGDGMSSITFQTVMPGQGAGTDDRAPATSMTLSSNALTLPGGPTTQRPGEAGMQGSVNGMIRYNSDNGKFEAYQGGAWQDILTSASTGATALSSVTAATGANTITSSDNAQVWNWALTTADKDAFTFGESAAASGGGSQSVLKAQTLASSTAIPLMVTNLGDGLSFRVNDETDDADTTPFVIDASGKVGIGLAAPAHELHVVDGAASGWGALQVEGSSADAGGAELILVTDGDGSSSIGANNVTGWAFEAYGNAYTTASRQNDLLFTWVDAAGAFRPRVTFESDGSVGIGTTDPLGLFNVKNGDSYLTGEGVNFADLYMRYADNATASAPDITLERALGSLGTPGALTTAGTRLGGIIARGYEGSSSFADAAGIQFVVDGTPGTDDMPGRIEFQVSPNGSDTMQTRMVLKNTGHVGIGSSDPAHELHLFDSASGGWAAMQLEGSAADTGGAEIFLVTNGDGSTSIGSGGVTGWALEAYGNSFSTASHQNDFYLTWVDGAGVWTPRFAIDATGSVGVGVTSPEAALDVDTTTPGTIADALIVPRGSDADQPGAAGMASPVNGMIRYNTTDSDFEVYAGGAWLKLLTGASGGTPNLATVLTAGNNASNQSAVNLSAIGIGTAAPTGRLHTEDTIIDGAPCGVGYTTGDYDADTNADDCRAIGLVALTNGAVAIGTAAPDASAALQIDSADRGLLIPRMADPTAITSPVTGMLVFDTDAGSSGLLQFFDGSNWVNVGAGGAISSALSSLTAATGTNTITSADNAQVWNWALTTADKDAFTFGESTAATGGGSQSVLKAQTLASSTATPLMVTNLGDGLSLRVNDETGDADATPFVIDAAGRIGIGTASPSEELTVLGDDAAIAVRGSDGNLAIKIGDGVAGATEGGRISLYINNELYGRIFVNGDLNVDGMNYRAEAARRHTFLIENTPAFQIYPNHGAAIGSAYAATHTPPADGLLVEGKIGIGTNSPDASSILDITSTTGGFLPPRMTAAQRDAIGTPAEGLTVYTTDAGTSGLLQFYDGSNWVNVGAGGAISSALSSLTAATGT
ncbi:MAG: hypothetical protein EOM26_12295, partial [Alphaproteobacteria bacterium]|nr:hypothetical protein [Alphaproteobacteria bacterium]